MTTPPVPRSILIVGAGLAGLRSVGELRNQGFTGHITLVGAEDVPPYDRPPLSKNLFEADGPLWLADDLGIDLAQADDVLLSSVAVGLEIGASEAAAQVSDAVWPGYRVLLDDDRILRADAVVLACGSVPVLRPEWMGTEAAEGVRTLHSAADSERLRVDLTASPRARLICIGAGWIGAEISGLAASHGCDVTVVEAGSTPLRMSVGEEVGALTAAWYDDVTLLTHAVVTSASAHEVHLADGRQLSADVVLAAVGARPATDWLSGSVAGEVPLGADGSINVDAHMRLIDSGGALVPRLAGVRAVGDCAARESVRHGRVPGGHWDAALRGPAAAVASLLAPGALSADATGVDVGHAPDPAPYVFSTQFGRELALYGHPGPDDHIVLRGDPSVGPGSPGWAALYFARTDAGLPSSDGGSNDDLDRGELSVASASDAPTPATMVPPDAPAPAPEASSRVLTGIFLVDRPRDNGAARKLFAGNDLSRLDVTQAANPDVKLTAARVQPTS